MDLKSHDYHKEKCPLYEWFSACGSYPAEINHHRVYSMIPSVHDSRLFSRIPREGFDRSLSPFPIPRETRETFMVDDQAVEWQLSTHRLCPFLAPLDRKSGIHRYFQGGKASQSIDGFKPITNMSIVLTRKLTTNHMSCDASNKVFVPSFGVRIRIHQNIIARMDCLT